MPALTNARHERFAQELAAGKKLLDAHALAGFKPNRGNAATLRQKESISNRLAEILTERETIHQREVTEAIKAASLSKQWVLERLMENAERALQRQAVLDDEGAPIGEYIYNGSVANRALELLGKEQGMFIDRKEVGKPGEFESLNADDLRAHIARENAALGIGAASPPATNGSGKPH